VIAIHAGLLGCSIEQARYQLRGGGRDGLAGALGRPAHYAHYADSDLAHQAAVLAHGVAEGQHFVEGNKRTALIALDVFLRANGYRLAATPQQRAQWMIDLSRGLAVDDLAARVRAAIEPFRPPLPTPLRRPYRQAY
jgi:death-on-curing protein